MIHAAARSDPIRVQAAENCDVGETVPASGRRVDSRPRGARRRTLRVRQGNPGPAVFPEAGKDQENLGPNFGPLTPKHHGKPRNIRGQRASKDSIIHNPTKSAKPRSPVQSGRRLQSKSFSAFLGNSPDWYRATPNSRTPTTMVTAETRRKATTAGSLKITRSRSRKAAWGYAAMIGSRNNSHVSLHA
jgi:hypothetical protein